MIQTITNPSDPRYLFMMPDNPSDISGLLNHINKVPLYQLLPTFKGIPERQIFIDKFVSKSGRTAYYCPIGLWREIDIYLTQNHIQHNTIPNELKLSSFNMSKDEFKTYVKSWGMNIEPRDYQIDAAWLILKYQRSISELATRAGKTLLAYMVFRTAIEKLDVKKILMIVPSIHLVKQGAEDMSEYQEFFNSEQIWAKGEHVETANLTIGTFQSLVLKADKRSKKYNPDFFKDYDLICVDEAHKLPCKSIKTILSLDVMKNAKIIFGFTGSMPKPGTIENICCQAMTGPQIQTISSKDLIDGGYLADPIIKQIRLKYPVQDTIATATKCAEYLLSNYVKKNGSKVLLPKDQRTFTMIHEKELPVAIKQMKMLYDDIEYYKYLMELIKSSSKTLDLEQMLTQLSSAHLDVIDKIVAPLKKNVIIFAHNTEYISFLYKYFTEKYKDRKVLKITGSTTLKKRQDAINEMLEQDNCILIGSFGAVGTGLTFKNVDYGIFAQSFASDVISRQSIGRMMLKTSSKSEFYVYDICDEYVGKKIHSQALAKIRTYKEQQFKYEIENLDVDYRPLL